MFNRGQHIIILLVLSIIFSCNSDYQDRQKKEIAISRQKLEPVGKTDTIVEGNYPNQKSFDAKNPIELTDSSALVEDTILFLTYFASSNLTNGSCILGTVDQWGEDLFSDLKEGKELWIGSIEYKLVAFGSSPKFLNNEYSPVINQTPILYDSLNIDRQCIDTCMIQMHYTLKHNIPEGPGIISSYPMPKQTWKLLKPTKKDISFLANEHDSWERIDLIKTTKGNFLIVQYDTFDDGEFIDHLTLVYRNDEGWKLMGDFEDHWNWPFVDIDGDGVPELYGSSQYKSIILRRFYPVEEIITYVDPGV